MDIEYKYYLKTIFKHEEEKDESLYTLKSKIVDDKKKFGIVDKKDEGKIIIPYNYDYIFPGVNGIFRYLLGDKYGFIRINPDGKLIDSTPCWTRAEDFSEGRALVRANNNSYTFIDENFQQVYPHIFYYAKSFSEGLAVVFNDANDKYGYIDKNGNEVIPYIYNNAYNFYNGYAIVENNDKKSGIIDKKGHEVIPCIYGYMCYKFEDADKLGFAFLHMIEDSGKDIFKIIDKNKKIIDVNFGKNTCLRIRCDDEILEVYDYYTEEIFYKYQYYSPTEYYMVNNKGIKYVTFSDGQKYSFFGEYVYGFKNHIVFKEKDKYYIYDRVNKIRTYLDTSEVEIKGKFLKTDLVIYYVGDELVDLGDFDISNYVSDTKSGENVVSYETFKNSNRVDILISKIQTYSHFIPEQSKTLKEIIDEYNKKSEEYLHKKFSNPSFLIGESIDDPKEKLKEDLEHYLEQFNSNKDLFNIIYYIILKIVYL